MTFVEGPIGVDTASVRTVPSRSFPGSPAIRISEGRCERNDGIPFAQTSQIGLTRSNAFSESTMAEKQTTHAPVRGSPDQPPAQPKVVMPPTPPGESSPAAVQKTQAVADALVQLGDQFDPQRVAAAVKAQTGIDLDLGEVATIVR